MYPKPLTTQLLACYNFMHDGHASSIITIRMTSTTPQLLFSVRLSVIRQLLFLETKGARSPLSFLFKFSDLQEHEPSEMVKAPILSTKHATHSGRSRSRF